MDFSGIIFHRQICSINRIDRENTLKSITPDELASNGSKYAPGCVMITRHAEAYQKVLTNTNFSSYYGSKDSKIF